MRINTDGKSAWREDLYDRVGEQLGENTRLGRSTAHVKFIAEMIPALEATAEHPDMTEKLANNQMLETSPMLIYYPNCMREKDKII